MEEGRAYGRKGEKEAESSLPRPDPGAPSTRRLLKTRRRAKNVFSVPLGFVLPAFVCFIWPFSSGPSPPSPEERAALDDSLLVKKKKSQKSKKRASSVAILAAPFFFFSSQARSPIYCLYYSLILYIYLFNRVWR